MKEQYSFILIGYKNAHEIRKSIMSKLLRVNLDQETYEITEMPDKYLNLGGRGLASRIICQEVSPTCDPLGKENKLIIAPGILAGTPVPNSGRLSIGAKSPLTKGIKEANAGGAAARKLVRLGIQAVVLEGRAAQLTTIKIDKAGVSLINAGNLTMKGNGACIDFYRNFYGEKINVISIGQAGEMELRAAGISVTSPDFFPRIAARGGLGAVMGSKRVKAIVIDDTDGVNVTIKNNELFKASLKSFTQGITSHPLAEGLKLLGTPMLVGLINEMGADHTCGNALPSPANPDYNPSASENQAPVSQFLQRYFAAIDTLGMCLFAALPPLDMPELQGALVECVSMVLDESLGDEYLMRLGGMVLSEERKFNLAAGLDKETDRLPSFFSKEPLSPLNYTFDLSEDELDSVHDE